MTITAPEDRAVSWQVVDDVRSGREKSVYFEKRYIRKDGSRIWVSLTVSMQRGSDGKAKYMISIVKDVNGRKLAEERLAEETRLLNLSEERLRATTEFAPIGVGVRRDRDRMILSANQALLEILGYEHDEFVGHRIDELGLFPDPVEVAALRSAVESQGAFRRLEVRFRRKDGEPIHLSISGSRVEIDGEPCLTLLAEDLTHRKEAEREIQRLSYSDALTGLPNRRMLDQFVLEAIAVSQATGQRHALMAIDLDNFKTLNDTLGHQQGDQLLKEAARRIGGCLRFGDNVARIDGDEFVVVLRTLGTEEDSAARLAEGIARRILTAIARPVDLAGRECLITCSIGVCMLDKQTAELSEAMQQADIALYSAKAAGRKNFPRKTRNWCRSAMKS